MGQVLSLILHPYHECHGIFVLVLVAGLLVLGREHVRHIVDSRRVVYSAFGLAGLVVVTYFGIMFLRVVGVDYSDHLEATVASISWLVVHGYPGYPNWQDGDLYGGIYGPLLFWINGAALLVSPTITSTKLVAAAAVILGGIALWSVYARAVMGWQLRLLLAGLLIEQLLPYRYTVYWIRAEPFLYLLAALAVVAKAAHKPAVSVALVGLLAGLAIDLKIHGMFYMMPIGLSILANSRTRWGGIGLSAIAASTALVAVVAPLIADHTAVLLYVKYLVLAASHGIVAANIIENVEIAAALAFPLLAIWTWQRPILQREDVWFTYGLVVSAIVVIILGSKIGAMPNYLLPLAPSFFYLIVRMLIAPTRQTQSRLSSGPVAAIFLVIFACNAATWMLMLEMIPPWWSDQTALKMKRNEFIAMLTAHPDVETGAAGDETYPDTFFASLQVIQNSVLHISIPAWMDLREGRVDEDYALRFIRGCVTPAWILPKGEPFSLVTPYTGKALFSPRFREDFIENYNLTEQGKFYTIWSCRRP